MEQIGSGDAVSACLSGVEQERLEVIACYALWQLRDLDPAHRDGT